MDDHDREIPHYFICPISLQIMKDPVTVATGITYDRDSIQQWQSHAKNKTCPVTNQPLPITADFTPNHNLRRLIQAWCVSDDQVSSNQELFKKEIAITLIKNVSRKDLQLESLKSLEKLSFESENNRVCLKKVGIVKAMVKMVILCYQNCTIIGLKEALNILYLVRLTNDDIRSILVEQDRIVSSLTWVLDLDTSNDENEDKDDNDISSMKFHAIVLLKDIINNAKLRVLERLKREFFKMITLILRQSEKKGLKECLQVMISTCTWPRNCSMMIEAGAVFELVEMELGTPEKAITELIMEVLFHLCSTADGRAQLLGHAAGIAMITKRIGKVSAKVDERVLMIISLISKFSATDGVLQEMVRVGTVEKLCMVLQVNGRHSYARDKAREILKRHSNAWKDSPCLDVTLLTRIPR